MWDGGQWSDVLMEEVGEVSRVLNELRHRHINAGEAKAQLRKELVQVAAMACAWAEAIDLDYEVTEARQDECRENDHNDALENEHVVFGASGHRFCGFCGALLAGPRSTR